MATGGGPNVSSNTGVHRGNTCPETGFGLLVHLPHLWIFQGEHAEPLRILRKDRLHWIASHQGRHGCFAQNCNWLTQVSKQRTRCKAFFSPREAWVLHYLSAAKQSDLQFSLELIYKLIMTSALRLQKIPLVVWLRPKEKDRQTGRSFALVSRSCHLLFICFAIADKNTEIDQNEINEMRNASKHGVDTGLTGKRDLLDKESKLETAGLKDCRKNWKEKSRVAHICGRRSNLETELLDSNLHRNFSRSRHCYCKSSCIDWYKDQRNQTESEICWTILVIVICWKAIAGKNTKTHMNKINQMKNESEHGFYTLHGTDWRARSVEHRNKLKTADCWKDLREKPQ